MMKFYPFLLKMWVLALCYSNVVSAREEFWIEPSAEPLVFEQPFELKGCALSTFQNGGHPYGESNWSHFENQKIHFNFKNAPSLYGKPAIENNQKIGKSTGFYEHAFEDIKLLKALNCNAWRISIEWADIEPQEGIFNQELITFLRKVCAYAKQQGITTMITLYHFVHPWWFEEMGGFEKQENLGLFTRYCAFVYSQLGDIVPLWCTINEPTVVSACGYILGVHAPGHVFKFNQAGIVLWNLLQAHVLVYKMIKKMAHGQPVQVGFSHAMLRFEPYRHVIKIPLVGLKEMADPFSATLARSMSYIFGHEIIMQFFTTGAFEYSVPGITQISRYCKGAPESLDFFGLNFYSQMTVAPHPTCYAPQTMTEMEYAVWPEKMYDALHEINARLAKPIYITENGIPDSTDQNRPDFLRKYLTAIHAALKEGCDIRGYFHWTLMDNFEWNEGFNQKFGLFHVDFDDTDRARTARPSAFIYRDYMQLATLAA